MSEVVEYRGKCKRVERGWGHSYRESEDKAQTELFLLKFPLNNSLLSTGQG